MAAVRLLQDFHSAFADVTAQLNNGVAQPVIALTRISSLGLEGVEILKKHLEESTKAHFTFTVNASANSVTLTPTGPMSTTSSPEAVPSSSGESKKGAATKISRPPNSFIIYRKEWHPRIVQQNPDLHNNDISVIIGNKWKAESDAVKAEYKQKAEDAKRQHAVANPGYQYQPRKPSEKKKRMTKNKIAKLAAKTKDHHGVAVQQQDLPADFDPLLLLDQGLAQQSANTSTNIMNFSTTWETQPPSLVSAGPGTGYMTFDAGDDINELFAKEIEDWSAEQHNQVGMQVSTTTRVGHPIVNGRPENFKGQTIIKRFDPPGPTASSQAVNSNNVQSANSIFEGYAEVPSENTAFTATDEVNRQCDLDDDFAALFDYDAAVSDSFAFELN